jgi:hypothetical protein
MKAPLTAGIGYLVGALDVHADHLRIRARPRRNGASTLVFMKQIRLAYPRSLRLYWIQDNLSSHWTPEIRTWAEGNNMELVPTPTYAAFRCNVTRGRTSGRPLSRLSSRGAS